ncbi:ATP-binding protein [Agrococcus casei]|uniref:sensor histidine kinase n=1 Tax=Agrococcus casei TaxID=343512 RepID=UPI003F8E4714
MTEPAANRPRRTMPAISVRARIVGVVALLSLVGMLVAGGSAYFIDRQRQFDQIDGNLYSALEAVQFAVGDSTWRSADEALEAVVSRPSLDDNTGILGIVNDTAAIVPGLPLDVQLETFEGFVDRVVAEVDGQNSVLGTFSNEKGSLRYLAVPISVTDADGNVSGPVIYVIAYDLERELTELNDAAGIFMIASVIVVLLIVVIGMWISGRLLRPIGEMSALAQRISTANLDERIPVTGRDDVSRMAQTVNEMLDRLDAGLISQRQLMQDVGHELNTPITIVRGHLELLDVNDAAEVEEAREISMDELDRMAGLVDDIRLAAKLQDPKQFDFDLVNIPELVASLQSKARAVQGINLHDGPQVPQVGVIGDEAKLTQGMLQYAANAAKYAPGDVTIGARFGEPGYIDLFVRDSGEGVADELKDAVFERFNRGTSGERASGSGLGLSIVRAIAERHRGGAWVRDAHPGAEFVLTLPIAVPEQHAIHHKGAPWLQS